MSLSRVALSIVLGASLATLALAQQSNNTNSGKGSSSSPSQSHPSSSSNSTSSHNSGTTSRQNGTYHYGSSGNSYHGYSNTSHYGSNTYHSYSRAGTTGTTHSTQSNGYTHATIQNKTNEPFTNGNDHSLSNVNGLGNQEARTHGAGTTNTINPQSAGTTSHNSPYTGNHNYANGFVGSARTSGQALIYNSTPYLARRGGWREGYYSPGWHDSTFFFGFYVFSPFESACVVSPWYYYPCLPPYLAYNRVIVLNDNCDWNDGSEYSYVAQEAPNSYGDSDLNSAISQIQNVFQNDDESAISQVVDSNMQVGVYNDGKYMYSVNGPDFSQMMADNVHGVQNVGFTVTDVKVEPDYAIVTARHEFQDAEDGGSTVVYQEYRLTRNGDHYAIEDFNTSKSPGGARTFF
jgi:hypothetical protein